MTTRAPAVTTRARRWLPLALALAAMLATASAVAGPAPHAHAVTQARSAPRAHAVALAGSASRPHAVAQARPAPRAHAHAAARHRPRAARLASRAADPLRGHASYYAARFHGRRTANGERYDAGGFTAAHRTLPFGTRVEVTNTLNQRTVMVQVNDRGPMRAGRVIDVSRAAAAELGILGSGWAPVTLRIADVGTTEAPAANDVSEDSLTLEM
ncbi:MAG: septal ring lytic transglycosylase RlpA family protein [Burkholderiaceae bacterium]